MKKEYANKNSKDLDLEVFSKGSPKNSSFEDKNQILRKVHLGKKEIELVLLKNLMKNLNLLMKMNLII